MSSGSGSLRELNVERLSRERFDVLVLGGGINGAASAAALASHGASVALVDKGDFASATSQESSNLVWGGIKYLEAYELGLVRRLCRSRNALIRAYPSSVREIRFFTSHSKGFRQPLWKLEMGAWLYWFLGGGFTRRPRRLALGDIAREEPVVALDGLDGGLEYSDAFLPDTDARFVWGFIRSALDAGCAASNYVESLGSRRVNQDWLTTARDVVSGREITIRSGLLVNACGPFADRLNARSGVVTVHHHVLSKGIHLIVDRITPSDRALTFFADDGRMFFVIPLGPRSSIGTTDTPVDAPEVEVTAEDRRFVLENINKRLRLATPLTEADVVAERCGVRPLVVDGAGADGRDWLQLSRRHVIESDPERRHVTIFGGKLTDCLNVGQEVCAAAQTLGVALPRTGEGWFGEPDASARRQFFADAMQAGLDSVAAEQVWRRHGASSAPMLEVVRTDPVAGQELAAGTALLRCELAEAARREMVVKLEDFLRRRTTLAQVVRGEELRRAPWLREVSRALFGDAAESKEAEYFAGAPDHPGGRIRTEPNMTDPAPLAADERTRAPLPPSTPPTAPPEDDRGAGTHPRRHAPSTGRGSPMRLQLHDVGYVVAGETYLQGIDLELEPGSFNVLLGPTQAGKTSLLRLLAGLDRPTSGTLVGDGVDISRGDVRGRNVAMVYQEFVNYPSFTVYDNIAAPLRRARRLPAAQVDGKVRAVAETLHIEALLDRLPSELSGGQQQRVALARALVKDARLLLLDEPLVNLDYKLREELRGELREILGRGSTTVVYATTEPAEGLLFGGKTGVLDAGRLLQFGPGLDVYHRPATVRVSEVFSDPPINLIPARIGPDGCRLSPSLALPLADHMRALPPGDYRVGLRSNQIGVVNRSGAAGVMNATAQLAEINGSETYLHARHHDFTLIAQLEGVHEFALGAPVTLHFDARKLFVFDGAGRLAAAPARRDVTRGVS